MADNTVGPNAHNVRKLRIHKGWTQAELAHAAGLDEKTIRSIENGKPKYVATLVALAKALSVPLESVLQPNELTTPTVVEAEKAQTSHLSRDTILSQWRDANALIRLAWQHPGLPGLAQHVAETFQRDAAFGDGELLHGETGHVYPFLTFPLTEKQKQDCDILGGVSVEYPRDNAFVIPDGARTLWDQTASVTQRDDVGVSYRLMKASRTRGRLQLHGAPGTYQDGLLTGDWLGFELLHAAAERARAGTFPTDQQACTAFLDSLPTRHQLFQNAGSPTNVLHGGRFRCAAIAVSTLFVYRDDLGRLLTTVRLRSDVGTAPAIMHAKMFHVAPSAMFQPTARDVVRQWDLRDVLFREFGEELFSPKKDFDQDYRRNYLRYPPVRFLDTLLESGEATLRLVGFGFNVWNLRPEILLLLWIDTPDWYLTHGDVPPRLVPERWRQFDYHKHRLRFNREFDQSPTGRALIPICDKRGWLDADRFRSEVFTDILREAGVPIVEDDPFHPAHWVPPGAAAFWLGLRELHNLARH
jgi:DNA-binding XRE family transcriptional regulator